jgi:DNA helicase-2/ATP-dependent DNA helicase PcrA
MSRFLRGVATVPDNTGDDAARPRRDRRQRRPTRCRICGSSLTTPAEQKLRHCTNCEVDVDLDLFERLRAWRLAVAHTASVPAYVVFTDATLTAIAQDRPGSVADLLAIPGVGATKIDRYGADVLALVAGDEVVTEPAD